MNQKDAADRLLEINDLKTSFFTPVGEVKAIDGVSAYLNRGETLGIVGESGSGKSVSMLSLMGLLPEAGKVISGEILFDGKDLTKLKYRKMEEIRGNRIGIIFQDPMTSLNPVFTVGAQLVETIVKHKKISKETARRQALEYLDMVSIPDAAKRMKQYPHEFSGGMRQRVMIAMAICCEPELIIADEPTTALDVTIQAQILDLMKSLKKRLNTSIILITHDLGVVADICNRVNVMYAGAIVEKGSSRDIFYNPRHPYTRGLLKSVPNPKNLIKERLIPIKGQPPDLLKPPAGCGFAPRCPSAMKICVQYRPPLYDVGKDHTAACFLNHESAPKGNIPFLKEKNSDGRAEIGTA